jgi:predicted nucleotide-binding protein (sugar kinase/HSP70/actin superfamily)
MKIGIPRALFYWKKPYFWETFFENLGIEVIFSPETNKEIVEKGLNAADTETCFSVKVLYGHVLFLEGKVDFIFIPRLKKNELDLEYCPKFFALPDLFPLLVKTPIISAWIDLKKENLRGTLLKLARKLGKNKNIAEKAIEISFLKERQYKEEIKNEYSKKLKSDRKKIVLISHPYNLYDEYVNLGAKRKIEDLGGEVILIDEVSIDDQESEISNQTPISSWPNFHWEFGQEVSLQIRKVLGENIAGAIEISAFQCGCDAVLKEFVEREFRENKIPFLYLLVDEYTGEAGLQTRLEAFFDTLK